MGPLISGKSRLVKYYNLARNHPFVHRVGTMKYTLIHFWGVKSPLFLETAIRIFWKNDKAFPYPIGSMGRLYIYLHEWLIFMVNVVKDTIQGWYGYRNFKLENFKSNPPMKVLFGRPSMPSMPSISTGRR